MRIVVGLVLFLLSLKAYAVDPRLDWKTIETSNFYIHFADKKALQLVSAFASDTALVLGHLEIDDRSNEIPA